MRWSQAQLDEYLRRRKAGDKISCAVIQKQEANSSKSADNSSRDKRKNGASYQRFRISIDLRYATARRRDIDGAASTILDCLLASRRRLLDLFAGTDDQGKPM